MWRPMLLCPCPITCAFPAADHYRVLHYHCTWHHHTSRTPCQECSLPGGAPLAICNAECADGGCPQVHVSTDDQHGALALPLRYWALTVTWHWESFGMQACRQVQPHRSRMRHALCCSTAGMVISPSRQCLGCPQGDMRKAPLTIHYSLLTSMHLHSMHLHKHASAQQCMHLHSNALSGIAARL